MDTPCAKLGDAQHREYWIPAADLSAMNEKIVGRIEVMAQFRGAGAV